jgi:ribosomal protein S18 acetylase RimI-like enzyme
MTNAPCNDKAGTGHIVRRVDDTRLAAALAPAVSPIVSRVSINIRPATMDDVAFIDSQQKAHSRELGFLPTAALEGKVKLGQVLLAEVRGQKSEVSNGSPNLISDLRSLTSVGYLIASDRYFKRDEIGYITQISVVPEFRRSLVAASLLQAQFDRSAYGCRLYCCWCAQDLTAANEFWEAMGFTAIAFRTGSRTRGPATAGKLQSEVRGQNRQGSRAAGGARIHIFWQKRVRAEDAATPWWYPSQTTGGEMREDRLVFPIPPGVSWRDVLPVVLTDERSEVSDQKSAKRPRGKKVLKAPPGRTGGLWFKREAIVERDEPDKSETKLAKRAIDPRLTKMARELRDRWQERSALILPAPAKHDERRMIASDQSKIPMQIPSQIALPEAA